MPSQKVLHFNPPQNNGKTRCGRKLSSVRWTEDARDATCNSCQRLRRMQEKYATAILSHYLPEVA